MTYRVVLVQNGTWKQRMELQPLSAPWSRGLNSGKSGQMTLQAGDLDEPFVIIPATTWPLNNWVVIEWDGTPVYAGVITDTEYDWKTKQVTLSHSDIWWYWSRRFVLEDRSNTFPEGVINWAGLRPMILAKRAIQAGMNGGSGPDYALPIVLPEEGAAGSSKRTVYGYNLESVQDILDELMESDNGFDLDFWPRWSSAGTLEFVMAVDAFKGRILEWDLDADETPVQSLKFRVAGSAINTRIYGVGEGSEKNMLAYSNRVQGTTYPALETMASFKEINTRDRLISRVLGVRRASSGAMRQVDMSVLASGTPGLGSFQLGALVRWRSENDTWLPSGWSEEWELLEMSGNVSSEEVSMAFRPRMAN